MLFLARCFLLDFEYKNVTLIDSFLKDRNLLWLVKMTQTEEPRKVHSVGVQWEIGMP